MRRPLDAAYDINPELVSSLFARYSDPSGWDGERLVDVEAFYGRLKRSVQPETRMPKERTGLEMHAARLNRDLVNHPHGRHPHGAYPRREALSMH